MEQPSIEICSTVSDLFDIKPDEDLNLCARINLHHRQQGLSQALAPIFEKYKPDAVLVHGDTATCFASTLPRSTHAFCRSEADTNL